MLTTIKPETKKNIANNKNMNFYSWRWLNVLQKPSMNSFILGGELSYEKHMENENIWKTYGIWTVSGKHATIQPSIFIYGLCSYDFYDNANEK